ncbi:alpha/beta fold hydrolase [Halorubrum sp. JWXQ-INN 858]|uniref:S9 family peptidase n=1 Tax=Halorubrum sp. JWXQ-INN 858 TaxID=2690782 RepID=UPI00135C480E|nr:S9 family peptidase [Halorubrum sp. JWXQ-INN 858]MWV65212.1 alpha/beta fold hydrolase [Halorubrum sp. JWXQ-INN 858]
MPTDDLPDYPVARYLGIDTVSEPTFTADGTLLYLADTAGSPDVWRRAGADAAPERLTGHDQRVSFVAASPTRAEAAFGMDRGSDERDQLFVYDLETGEETDLTADPSSIHSWGGWSPDGDRIAYAANRRRTDTFDVHVQRRDATADGSDVVLEGLGGFLEVAAWGPDGDRLALIDARASFAQDLYVLDLTVAADTDAAIAPDDTATDATATDATAPTDLASHPAVIRVNADDDATYADPTFGADGGLYVRTNQPDDHTVLARFDLEAVAGASPDERPAGPDDPALSVVAARDGWNVDGYALDRGSGRVAYTANVDGYSELVVGELADPTTVRPIAEPDVAADAVDPGVIETLAWGPDAERLVAGHSATDRPGRAVVVAVDDRPTTTVLADHGTLGLPHETFPAPEIVRYETFDGREIPAYWTLPPGVDADDPATEVPVIVDIHGGPEHQRRPWFQPMKAFYLRRGYAVFEPNVRGSSGYGKAYTHLDDTDKRMDSVADLAAAVDWLADRPAVDDDRIVAYGRSYGGFMVLAAITEYPDLWAAAVDFVGIADFETFLENTGEWRRSHREQEYGALENTELLERISPIHRVDRIACPLFVQHGANDPRVPVSEAEQIIDAVSARGVPVESCVFDDEGHHTTSRDNRIEQFERIAAFLDDHVGGA